MAEARGSARSTPPLPGPAMPYADFTLEGVEASFGLTARPGVLFPGLAHRPVPGWLGEILERGRQAAAMVSEKARSEFLVVPILLAARELVEGPLAIYSGQRLDVDLSLGLVGECDFILALTPPVPRLKAPLVTVLEAKKGDVESGLGQCAAQMVAARIFNQRAGEPDRRLFGCVTTGEAWQFLRLDEDQLAIDTTRLYVDDVGGILATLGAILGDRARS